MTLSANSITGKRSWIHFLSCQTCTGKLISITISIHCLFYISTTMLNVGNLFRFLLLCSLAMAKCNLNPTSCSCSLKKNPNPCFQEVTNKPGACALKECEDRWSCDCTNPTHMCSRETCLEYITVPFSPQPTPILTVGEVECPPKSSQKCARFTGEPMAPVSIIAAPLPLPLPLPLPSPSPSLSPSSSQNLPTTTGISCTDSFTCGEKANCMLKTCQLIGSCPVQLDAYCKNLGNNMKCCPSTSQCSRDYFHDDVSFCSQSCNLNCLFDQNRLGCAFQTGGARLSFFPPFSPMLLSFSIDACDIVS